jgi:hypothetical protein
VFRLKPAAAQVLAMIDDIRFDAFSEEFE